MKKIFTLLTLLLVGSAGISQTTVYETGQVAGDPWTGWSVVTETNCTAAVTGANGYAFSGTNGATYTAEIKRQFTFSSNDIDIYFAATSANSTISIEYSTDDVSYTQIATMNWGAGYSQSQIVEPTFDPGGGTFYLKLKVTGTFGSPSNTTFNTFKIDAVLNSSGIDNFEMGSTILFANKHLEIVPTIPNYTVQIMDITGKVITTEKNMTQYDFSSHSNGVYFISLTAEDGSRKTVKIANR